MGGLLSSGLKAEPFVSKAISIVEKKTNGDFCALLYLEGTSQ